MRDFLVWCRVGAGALKCLQLFCCHFF